MTDEKRLRGRVRWSMAARCPRMAAYGLAGVTPEIPDERALGRFARGHDAQRYHSRRLEAKYGEGSVIREKAVPWPPPPALPLGELHTDLFVIPEKLAIEVKSSAHPGSLFETAMTQLAGQVVFDPEAERGALTFLDHEYQETATYPLVPTDEVREEVEEIAATVVDSARNGTLPDRVCSKPSDGLSRHCPFIEHCFDGWEPPDRSERDDLDELAKEFLDVYRTVREYRRDLKPVVERFEELRAALVEAELPAGETETPSGIVLKRTDVAGRQTFSVAKAIKGGVWTEAHSELFGDYLRRGDPSVRLKAWREGEEELDLDFGEEAPF